MFIHGRFYKLVPTLSVILQHQHFLQFIYYNNIKHVLYLQAGLMHQTIKSIRTIHQTTTTTGVLQGESRLQQLEKQQSSNRTSAISGDVSALCREGQLKEALGILDIMDERGIPIDHDIFAWLLDACTGLRTLAEGKKVHAHMLATGLEQNVFLNTKLVSLYAACGSMGDARFVFGKTMTRNIYLWNAMIRGCVRNGLFEEALSLYYQMRWVGMQPDNFTFPCVLKACTILSAVEQGKEIHGHIIRSEIVSDDFLGNALLVMYANCGLVDVAYQMFDKMPQINLISWNAMITRYARDGLAKEALKLFREMQLASLKPDSVTIASALHVCSDLAALQQGKEIHNHIVKTGLESNIFVGSALLDMYAKCNGVASARQVFDRISERDVVSWNAMIAGYAKNLYPNEALKLFCQMQLTGLKPDSFTIVSVLNACSQLAAIQQGREIHDYIIRSGLDYTDFVQSALVDMYAKCSDVETACRVFNKNSERDVGSWNAMVAVYAQNGHACEALKLFSQMQLVGLKPDLFTIASILRACASLATLQQGKEIHDYIIKNKFESDVFVGSALIDMYVKCGSIEIARLVFDKMPTRDVVCWNTMIAGYGMHGHGVDALALFDQMQQAGLKPVHVTFIALLSACSHAGLVDEGWKYFDEMVQHYNITPTLEHYSCMVDLLGRAGLLDKAHKLIKMMPLEPDASVWGALLGACRLHCNIELGEHVAEHLFELDPEMPGYYVLLSNIYAAADMWDGVAKVRTMMKDRGVKNKPGCSWIVVRNRVHEFTLGDRSHPECKKINETLQHV
eukprot:Gb_06272 [translate_table: standard]